MPIVLLVVALIVAAVFLAMTLCVIVATAAVTRSRRDEVKLYRDGGHTVIRRRVA